MRNSQVRKTQILQASVKLIAADGYEAATLKEIADASKAAIGNVVHFFDDKPRLAAAVLADTAGRFAAVIDRALQGEGKDIKRTVADAIGAVFDWVQGNPHDHLVSVELGGRRLGDRTLPPVLVSPAVLDVISAWAKPLIVSDQIAAMDERTIAAIILGTAWTIAAARPQFGGTNQVVDPALILRLTTAALVALAPLPATDLGTDLAAEPHPASAKTADRQQSLF